MNTKTVLLSSVLIILLFLQPLQAAESKYGNIDLYARFAPQEFEESVEMLARYLIDGAENDEESVRAFYIWLTDNISYDTKSYFSGRFPDQSAEATLKNRLSVCEGYANLFKALCDVAKISAVKIPGFSKGYGYNPSRSNLRSNHVWNAVQLDGHWFLLDATWGAGYIDKNRTFVKHFSEFYFLTKADELILTHLPDNHYWQLLSVSKSEKEFLDQVQLAPAWFEYGLQMINHKQAEIITQGPFTMRLKVPEEIRITAKIADNEKLLNQHYTFVQKTDSVTEISVVLPANNIFTLNIFAKQSSDSGSYKQVAEYRLDARRATASGYPFPETFSAFHRHGCYLFEPMTGDLKSGQQVQYKLQIPGAVSAAIVVGDAWIFFEKSSEDIFSGLMETVADDITVFAQFPGDKTYQALLRYKGNH